MGRLAEIFRSIFVADVEGDALEALLAARLAQARAAWPEVALDDATFVEHLARRAPRGGDLLASLAALATSDLYLACACARGAPGAVATFHQRFLARLPVLLGGLRLDRAALDDARQLVSQRLLLPRPDDPPRIAAYSGRGSLEGWLRIAAIRAVLNEREKERVHAVLDDDAGAEGQLLPSEAGGELELFRARHREDLAVALRTALEALSDRDRTLLRLHFMKGVPTVELGPLYGVHRTTVARWLDAAQQALLEGTRRILVARLQLSDSECASLIRALHSQLDITLSALDEPPLEGPD